MLVGFERGEVEGGGLGDGGLTIASHAGFSGYTGGDEDDLGVFETFG